MEEFENTPDIKLAADGSDKLKDRIQKYEEMYINELIRPDNEYLTQLNALYNDVAATLNQSKKIQAELDKIHFDEAEVQQYRNEMIKKTKNEQLKVFLKIPEYITQAVKNNDFYQANYLYTKGMEFVTENKIKNPDDKSIVLEFNDKDLYYYYIHSINSMQMPGQSIFFYISIVQFLHSIIEQKALQTKHTTDELKQIIFQMFKLNLERMVEDQMFRNPSVDTVEEASRQLYTIFLHATGLYSELNQMKEESIKNFIDRVITNLGTKIKDKVSTIESNLHKKGKISTEITISCILNEPKINFKDPLYNDNNISNFIANCVNNPTIWNRIKQDTAAKRFNQYISVLEQLNNSEFQKTFPNQFEILIKAARRSKFDTLSKVADGVLGENDLRETINEFQSFFPKYSKEKLVFKMLSKIAKLSYLADPKDLSMRRDVIEKIAGENNIKPNALKPVLRTLYISFRVPIPDELK